MELSDVHAELIALLKDALSACFDEGVELCCELCHAIAQLVEPEVDGRKGIGH